MQELIIRRYQPEDNSAAFNLHVRALKAIGAYVTGDGKWDQDMHEIEHVYLNGGGDFFVGIINKKLIATGALLKIDISKAEVKRMRVEPSLQGRGYGQAMLSHLEDRARELGFTELVLETGVIQCKAQRLYEKNGFREYARISRGSYKGICYKKDL